MSSPVLFSSYAEAFFIFCAANHLSLLSAAMACTKKSVNMFRTAAESPDAWLLTLTTNAD